MKDTTLKQIAIELGISITTVSKALKNYPDVSESTKKKVKDLAAALHAASERFFNAKGFISTHQLSDNSGVMVVLKEKTL